MTNTNYIKKHRDKRAADGLVRVDVWVHNTNKAGAKMMEGYWEAQQQYDYQHDDWDDEDEMEDDDYD
jgi:hypothetical protein